MNLRSLRKRKGLTMKELGARVGVTESAVGQWETGKRKPNYEMLLRISEELECSVADIIGADPVLRTHSESALERKYNALDAHGKKVVDLVLDEEYKRCTSAKPEAPVKPKKVIPLFGTAFAAGAGEWASDSIGSALEEIEVDADSPAEFAVKVNGDSMEPELHDGQIALCLKRSPQVGEIIVCMVNGFFYVKQFITDGMNIYLRSINRDRKDSDVDIWNSGDYSFLCFGTVIHKRIPLVQQ